MSVTVQKAIAARGIDLTRLLPGSDHADPTWEVVR